MGADLDPGFACDEHEQHLGSVGQVTAGVVAVVQVDAGEPAAQGEAEAVPGRGLLRCRQGGQRWKIWKAGIRQKNEQEKASTIGRAIRGYPAATRGYLLSPTGWSLSSL